jgi:arylsulfatase A-like enzyme
VRIVVITVDTLRADSFEGSETRASRMPLTRARAQEGLIFERFYATTSVTQPTHVSLFTGLPPWQHGVTRNGQTLVDEHVTVAECLQRAGFATSALVASYPLHPRFGLDQGFEQYETDFDQSLGRGQWEGHELGGARFYRLADPVTDRALSLLDTSRASKQFLWLHYFDPHDPYGDTTNKRPLPSGRLWRIARDNPAELPRVLQRARTLYDRDVEHLDRSVERLLTRLAAEPEIETHVVFTSDHGESFGEHGSIGHGSRLTPEQLHVPLFILSPRVQAGRRTDPAGSVDVAATLLDLAHVACQGIGGTSLLDPSAQRLVLGMRRTYASSTEEIRTDGRRVNLDRPRFFAVTDGALYAGDSDGVLRDDAVGGRPDRATAEPVQALFAGLERALAGASAPEDLDEEALEALRALGYVR